MGVFQEKVTSQNLALGNVGQIAKGTHGYLNVNSAIAATDISVGEFAQSSTNENEVKATKGKIVTGDILGVVLRDSLKQNGENIANTTILAGGNVTIADAGNVYVECEGKAYKGDNVLVDESNGAIVFSDESEGTGLKNTGWKVFIGNETNEKGIVGISTSVKEKSARPTSEIEVGDLYMKDGTIKKADDVTTDDLANALGIIAFIEQGTGRALITDLVMSDALKFCDNEANWINNSKVIVENNPAVYGMTPAGLGAMPTWNTDMFDIYRQGAINKGLTDDMGDATKYPGFYYAKNKGEGWIVPSGVGASYIHENLATINATLTALGATNFGGHIWTTSLFNGYGLFFKNMIINLDVTAPDYTQFRIKNDNGDAVTIAWQRSGADGQPKIIAIKAVNL